MMWCQVTEYIAEYFGANDLSCQTPWNNPFVFVAAVGAPIGLVIGVVLGARDCLHRERSGMK